MLFSLMNATATFRRLMNEVLVGYLFVREHIFDVLLLSKTLKENILDFKSVLYCIAGNRFKPI